MIHFPKALKRPRNNAGPASYHYYYSLQKASNAGIFLLSKTTQTQPHIHSHTSYPTTTHSAPRKTTVRLAWLTGSRRTPDTGINDLPSSQQPPTSDARSCPGRDTGVLRIHQSVLSRPALPTFHHLLTNHRQRQRTPLAIIRCFFDFSSPHTPAFNPGL